MYSPTDAPKNVTNGSKCCHILVSCVATLVRQPEAISYKLTTVKVEPFNNELVVRDVPDIDGQFCGC